MDQAKALNCEAHEVKTYTKAHAAEWRWPLQVYLAYLLRLQFFWALCNSQVTGTKVFLSLTASQKLPLSPYLNWTPCKDVAFTAVLLEEDSHTPQTCGRSGLFPSYSTLLITEYSPFALYKTPLPESHTARLHSPTIFPTVVTYGSSRSSFSSFGNFSSSLTVTPILFLSQFLLIST